MFSFFLGLPIAKYLSLFSVSFLFPTVHIASQASRWILPGKTLGRHWSVQSPTDDGSCIVFFSNWQWECARHWAVSRTAPQRQTAQSCRSSLPLLLHAKVDLCLLDKVRFSATQVKNGAGLCQCALRRKQVKIYYLASLLCSVRKSRTVYLRH